MSPARRFAWLLLLSCSVSGCGSSSPSAPSPVRSVVAQGQFSGIPSSDGGSANTLAATRTFPFTTSAAGTIDAVVDWSSSANQLAVALYPAGCVVGQLGFGSCNPLAQGNSSAKPGRVSLGAAAGSYTLGILNLGPGVESGSYEVGLTR